jgi:hypothetical protein
MKNNSYKINWNKNWNDEVCLWSQPYGHTPPIRHLKKVHSSRKASNLLLLAGETGQLKNINSTGILKQIRSMQTTDNSLLHGYIKWYFEETYPADTNAPFFVGLPLIILWCSYQNQLTSEQKEVLISIFNDLYVWFKRELCEQVWFYPNKALGDVVCVWMLYEICSPENPLIVKDKETILDLIHKAADYWTEHKWGWGEHLSDTYAKVCLDELSVLLLMNRKLPTTLQTKYKKLFNQLLEIEDKFSGGPKVPALRTYHFLSCPTSNNYRDLVAPLPSQIKIDDLDSLTRHTFYRLNWHQFVPQKKAPIKEVKIYCFDNTVTKAYIEKDIRIGSVSRFPIMPSMDRLVAGLSWQSMPVAISRPDKTWMFLQWETEEFNKVRRHPADDVKNAYLNYGLSEVINPPLTGKTYCIQKGESLIVLRIMPQISQHWEYLTDRLRIVGEPGEIFESQKNEMCYELFMEWGKRFLSINCLILPAYDKKYESLSITKACGTFCETNSKKDKDSYIVAPTLQKRNKSLDWDILYQKAYLQKKRLIASVWAFSLNKIIEAPKLKLVCSDPLIPRMFEENVWEIEWELSGKKWKFTVDPLSREPLKEE